MRPGPFNVMRIAPVIGRPNSPRRISVAARVASVEAGLREAEAYRRMYAGEGIRAVFWLERIGQPARRSSR